MCPAPHAGLWIFGVVVGQNGIDPKAALQTLTRGLDDCDSARELFTRGQQRLAILESPPIVLHVGDLQPLGAAPFRECDNLFEPVEVTPVDDGVQRESDRAAAHHLRNAQLELVGARAGEFVRRTFLGILQAQLYMVETGFDQGVQTRFV